MLKQERESRRKFKVDRRLNAFMQLLVRGWMEIPLDLAESRKVRRLIDAMIVILEGKLRLYSMIFFTFLISGLLNGNGMQHL